MGQTPRDHFLAVAVWALEKKAHVTFWREQIPESGDVACIRGKQVLVGFAWMHLLSDLFQISPFVTAMMDDVF